MQIHHINICAPSALLEQEKQFFCSVLGLQEGFRPKFSRDGYWLYSDSHAIVHLTESNVHFKSERQGFVDHVAFQSAGLQQLIQTLEATRVRYSTDFLPEIDMTQVFFKTPSDTGIEVNFINEKIGNTPGPVHSADPARLDR